MEKMIGSAIFFFVIGILSLIGIYLIYSAIHILGILIIFQPPWYELEFKQMNGYIILFFNYIWCNIYFFIGNEGKREIL